jgi:phosphoribosylformylglycinamidine (FGAM) synthase-like enzyme
MAIAGGVGAIAARVPNHDALFSESASRVIVAVAPDNMGIVENMAASLDVPLTRLGLATGDRISFKGLVEGSLQDATEQARTKLPAAMGAST